MLQIIIIRDFEGNLYQYIINVSCCSCSTKIRFIVVLILVLEIKVIYLLMLYLVSDETCIYQNISCNLNHSVIGRIIYSTEQLYYSASSVI